MPNYSPSKKLSYARRVGADLPLDLTNAPFLANILKLTTLTVPGSTGANSRSTRTGGFGGLTPGGTLTVWRKGQVLEINAGRYDGSYSIPDAVEELPVMLSSLGPASVTAGDLLNITGTNLANTKYVFVGGAQALISTANTTNTNVTVTVPLLSSTGNNIPVVVVTETGNDVLTTLTVTSGGTPPAKLAAPVVGQPSNITSDGFTISWAAVSGADGYRVRLNNSTLFMPGNVLTYTFTGLPANTLSAADVQALDSTGAKQASNYSNVVTASTATTAIARVLLRIGQSNGLDKSLASDADSTQLTVFPTLKSAQPNLQIWNPKPGAKAYQSVQIGVNDLSASDPTDAGGTAPGGGPAYPPTRGIFAGALALRLKELYANETFYFVKKSADGQSWNALLAGGGWRADLYARLAEAKAAIEAMGKTWKLTAVMVQFGENDFAAGRAFAPLANQFVSEITAEGYADADTIYEIGGLKDSDGVDKSSYRSQMAAWCAAQPATRKYAYSSNWQGISGDDIHLDGVTQMQMGHSDFPNALFGTTGGYRIGSTPPSGQSSRFTYYAPTSASPGSELLFIGNGFTNTPAPTFPGGLVAAARDNIGTELIATVPSGATAAGKLTVVTADGVLTSTDTFTPTAGPVRVLFFADGFTRPALPGWTQNSLTSGIKGPDAVVTTAGVRLAPANVNGANASALLSTAGYNLAGKAFVIYAPSVLSTANATSDFIVSVGANWFVLIENNQLYYFLNGAPIGQPIAYDTNLKWLGLGINSAGNAVFLTSADGVTYNKVEAGPAPAGTLQLGITASTNTNNTTASPAPGAAIVRLAQVITYPV